MSHDKAKADQLASPHLFGTHHRSFQRGYAARSAVVHCTRSSRSGWKTFLGSRWGVEGDRHFPPTPTSVLSIVRCCRLVLRRPRAIPCPKLLMGSRRVLRNRSTQREFFLGPLTQA